MATRRLLVVLALGATLACEGARETDAAADAGAEGGGGAAPAGATGSAAQEWDGRYLLRGTLEGGRQATGQLEVAPLTAGAPLYDETRNRVRRLYPTYEAPFFTARMRIEAGDEPMEGTFTCAHGPGSARPLVCEPAAPLAGLENATLVMNQDGRAVLTGSHGEGVSIEFGRFSWERANGA